MPNQLGFGEDFIEVTNGQVSITMPVIEFDELVKQYVEKREEYLAKGLVEGTIYDDTGGSIEI